MRRTPLLLEGMDEHLRRAERSYANSGSPADRDALVMAHLRAGNHDEAIRLQFDPELRQLARGQHDLRELRRSTPSRQTRIQAHRRWRREDSLLADTILLHGNLARQIMDFFGQNKVRPERISHEHPAYRALGSPQNPGGSNVYQGHWDAADGAHHIARALQPHHFNGDEAAHREAIAGLYGMHPPSDREDHDVERFIGSPWTLRHLENTVNRSYGNTHRVRARRAEGSGATAIDVTIEPRSGRK